MVLYVIWLLYSDYAMNMYRLLKIFTEWSNDIPVGQMKTFCYQEQFVLSDWFIVVHEYRDRIFIRKDILLKLCEYGEINQSKLMSYCGLNNVKHKEILDDMVRKGLISRMEENWGSKVIINYKVSERGRLILNEILAPYEELFPRNNEKEGRD